ncbi:hypothetical protein ANCDUO_24302 [Ancylostoma duodenale]|uniref:Uncharacterized protein n=1 Tax=Ancylostoma duodenale TaxID=51022 RepID=A0A0C2FLB5_9BILA|nr:hypothetical protein ANCDUO_24302 [Ancylostoma duodenale]
MFSSVVAFYYAHKAIVRPEEINYIPYVPIYILLGATAIIRLAACLVVFTLGTQILASFIVFCRRRDDYTKSSPYDQVRC